MIQMFFSRQSASEMLDAENKKMEEKLKLVQQMVASEKEKRASTGMRGIPGAKQSASSSSSMWGSSQLNRNKP